jgi:hypothetical protein
MELMQFNPLRTEVYFCHQNQNAKNIGNFMTICSSYFSSIVIWEPACTAVSSREDKSSGPSPEYTGYGLTRKVSGEYCDEGLGTYFLILTEANEHLLGKWLS